MRLAAGSIKMHSATQKRWLLHEFNLANLLSSHTQCSPPKTASSQLQSYSSLSCSNFLSKHRSSKLNSYLALGTTLSHPLPNCSKRSSSPHNLNLFPHKSKPRRRLRSPILRHDRNIIFYLFASLLDDSNCENSIPMRFFILPVTLLLFLKNDPIVIHEGEAQKTINIWIIFLVHLVFITAK
jgi:hypothetical protein